MCFLTFKYRKILDMLPNFDASVYDTSGVRDVRRLSPPLIRRSNQHSSV